MNKIIKLIILILLSLSVFYIYNDTKKSNRKILVLGDFLSKQNNNYLDYFNQIQLSNNRKITINKKYIQEDLTIHETLLLLKQPSLKKDLLESHFLIINLGLNDYLYKITLKEKHITSNNPLEEEQIELTKLLKEIKKYYKNTILVIGYPKTENKIDNIYRDRVNTILKEKEIIYLDTYHLIDNSLSYTDQNKQISIRLEKILEKEQII